MRDERKFITNTTSQPDAFIRDLDHAMEPLMKMLSLARFLRRRRTYRTVLQELSGYSDHELHDIGIDRADIHDIARRVSEEQQ